MAKIVNTDNFGGDYPNEKFVTGLPCLSEERLQLIADVINAQTGRDAPRFYKVVPDDYELQPGFEP